MSRQLFPLFLLLPLVLANVASAQQVECAVHVNYESVATSNKDLLRDFANDIKNYVNNYQWGSPNVPDRIQCTLNIFIQNVVGQDKYQAQIFVGSQRPIFGSEKSSVVVRIIDDAWEFTYIRDQPINHNILAFDDLASLLDFYMFLIVGYDADTYDRLGGTTYFRRAYDVASLGRSSGQKGWQQPTSGYSKAELIDELTNPAYEPIRLASWKYYYTGLDSLTIDPDRAYKNVLEALDMMNTARKNIGSRNLTIRTFFETKYMELADFFTSYPDRNIYAKLSMIDPAHQSTYEDYRTRQPRTQ